MAVRSAIVCGRAKSNSIGVSSSGSSSVRVIRGPSLVASHGRAAFASSLFSFALIHSPVVYLPSGPVLAWPPQTARRSRKGEGLGFVVEAAAVRRDSGCGDGRRSVRVDERGDAAHLLLVGMDGLIEPVARGGNRERESVRWPTDHEA